MNPWLLPVMGGWSLWRTAGGSLPCLRPEQETEAGGQQHPPSPVTMGLLSPVIIMPGDFPAERAYYVFLHELTHVRRMDGFYKWLVEDAVCLHWFKPAVYALQRGIPDLIFPYWRMI